MLIASAFQMHADKERMPATIVVFSPVPIEDRILSAAAHEYGWSLRRVRDVVALKIVREQCNIVAVVFHPAESKLAPVDVIGAICTAAPGAKLIVCTRFADATPWPVLAAAGAFHSLRVPFAMPEVRQSFGFVWAGQSLAAASA